MNINKRVIVIGAGASGYFAAIRIKELCPTSEVVIMEKRVRHWLNYASVGVEDAM